MILSPNVVGVEISAEISAEIYKVYSRLDTLSTQSPTDAIDDIEQFYRFSKKKTIAVKLLAADLAIRNSLQAKQPENTLRYLQDITQLALSNNRHLAYNMLGAQLSYQLQHYPSAIKYLNNWYQRATKMRDPNNAQESMTNEKLADTLMFLANSYYQNKNNEQAISHALTAINLTSRAESDYRFLFMLYEAQKLSLKARDLLITLTQLFPTKGEYWERLGYSYLNSNQMDQAIAVFDIAQQAGNLPTRSWLTLAQLFINQNMSQKAIQLLTQITTAQVLPCDATYYQLLANAQIISREHQAALSTLVALTQQHSSTLMQKKQQAQIAYRLGAWEVAEPVLIQLIDLESDNLHWRFMLAVSYYELKKYALAQTQFKQLTSSEYKQIAQKWMEQIIFLQQQI